MAALQISTSLISSVYQSRCDQAADATNCQLKSDLLEAIMSQETAFLDDNATPLLNGLSYECELLSIQSVGDLARNVLEACWLIALMWPTCWRLSLVGLAMTPMRLFLSALISEVNRVSDARVN